MSELSKPEITTKTLEHYGLVAAVCQKLKIAERIPNSDPRVIVSTGTAVVAMILNELRFIDHRLYMVSSFYASKPVERLLGTGIKAGIAKIHVSDFSILYIGQYQINGEYEMVVSSS